MPLHTYCLYSLHRIIRRKFCVEGYLFRWQFTFSLKIGGSLRCDNIGNCADQVFVIKVLQSCRRVSARSSRLPRLFLALCVPTYLVAKMIVLLNSAAYTLLKFKTREGGILSRIGSCARHDDTTRSRVPFFGTAIAAVTTHVTLISNLPASCARSKLHLFHRHSGRASKFGLASDHLANASRDSTPFPQETVRRYTEDMQSITRNIKRILSPRGEDFQAFTMRPADVYADIWICDTLTIRAFSDAIPRKTAIRAFSE